MVLLVTHPSLTEALSVILTVVGPALALVFLVSIVNKIHQRLCLCHIQWPIIITVDSKNILKNNYLLFYSSVVILSKACLCFCCCCFF